METMMITEKTTLGELLTLLNLAEKSGRTPTPRELFETAGEPIAEFSDCTLFSNGFAIYQNITGRTVVWLPYCKNFTFYFSRSLYRQAVSDQALHWCDIVMDSR